MILQCKSIRCIKWKGIYKNKQSIEKAIAVEKDNEIGELKKKNRRLIITNTALTLGITGLAFSTIYFAIL